MNGRLYDPVLGRMLSPDNYAHEGSQGANRYSYVLNNPLKFTDPDGENSVGFIESNGAVHVYDFGGNYVDRSAEPYYIAGGMVVVTGAYFAIKTGALAHAAAAAVAAGGAAAVASAIPFVAAAVAIYLYVSDVAHNVQQANTANNIAVQNVYVGQSGSSSYHAGTAYTPQVAQQRTFEPRKQRTPDFGGCNMGEDFTDLLQMRDEGDPKPDITGKSWYRFLEENKELFKHDSKCATEDDTESAYISVNNKKSTMVWGSAHIANVNAYWDLNISFWDLGLDGQIHFHPTNDNPLSTGDVQGFLFNINKTNDPDYQRKKPNGGQGYWDIAYSGNYIYVLEVTDIDKAKEFAKNYDQIIKNINMEVENVTTKIDSWHDFYMQQYVKHLSAHGISLYTAPAGTSTFTKIF
jgi:hypothetical protein